MKKTILMVALIVTGFVSKAQDSTQKHDLNAMPLISINDLNAVDQKLFGDMPSKYVDAIRNAFQQLVNQKVAALAPKPQPKPEPIKKK